MNPQARSFVCYWVGMGVILDVAAVAAASLVRFGPFTGSAIAGICIHGYGSATCYSAQPTSTLIFCLFACLIARHDPESVLPLMAFNVSFGELLFTLETLPTVLVPSHDAFHPENFQPLITVVWLAFTLTMPLILCRQEHRIRFDRLFIPWFAACTLIQLWQPYIHTTYPELLLSNLLMAWQCLVVWRMFMRPSESSDIRLYEVGSSPSSARSWT